MEQKTNSAFNQDDLAVIIPTKDRPQKMENILGSLRDQTVACGRIIVVDGGQSVEDVVMKFAAHLPVEYYDCHPPGQIRQRNLAISKLDNRTPLVAFLDDDIVLETDAIENVLKFWSNCDPKTAGVSFNIINNPPYRYSRVKALFGMSSSEQGRVLRSGYNVATTPVQKNLQTQWLSGGATVWKFDILDSHQHTDIISRWAICEDVIFSYPIGKKYPLYVCADAKVRHEHVYDHKAKMKYFYYGRTITLWRLYFEESHPELSRLFFLWMSLGQILTRFALGIFTFRMHHIQYALGQIDGAASGLSALAKGKQLLTLLNEKF